VAAFDKESNKTDRVISGCRCYHIDEAAEVIAREGIRVVIMAVPTAAAQAVSEKLVQAGVRGFLNFAPEPLRVPANVTVENMDMTMALEKTAFLARQNS
jgi:redox-sensing transcriptional repressor